MNGGWNGAETLQSIAADPKRLFGRPFPVSPFRLRHLWIDLRPAQSKTAKTPRFPAAAVPSLWREGWPRRAF